MKADIEQKLSSKIQKVYCLSKDNAQDKAVQMLRNCPAQLMPNICEWAEDRELTDIYIGKYSVPMIMSIWGRQDFLGALEVISEFLQGDADKAERRIWQMRR